MIISDLEIYEYREGDFNDLSMFDIYGVYIIYDPNNNNEVVYIGSAYARKIKTRLKQYLNPKDTGNTLAKTIARIKFDCKASDLNEKQLKEAVERIKSYKIKAIAYMDLEYKLIAKAKPKFNNNGIGED